MKRKVKLFSFLQKMSSMVDCCSSEDKNKTKNPLGSLYDPNKELPQDKRTPRAPAAARPATSFSKQQPAIKRVVQCAAVRVPQGGSLLNEMLDLRYQAG